jgi:MoaA/NifB/PqqE/SkfB family radical SAM enzyme
MKKLDKRLAAHMIGRGTLSYFTGKPIGLSFELGHSCTCNCRHCDHGGKIPDEKRLRTEDYIRLKKELKPTLLQLSGGEPLMHPELVKIARAMKENSVLPYLIVVTNGSLLNEDIYLDLVDAGINQLSISLDFPDDRHDDFRRHKGLFQHLSDIVPKLSANGYDNICMNTAITRWNLPHIIECYEKASEWGADISFSPYTVERIGEPEFDIKAAEDLELLDSQIQKLISLRQSNGHIANSEWTLTGINDFFKNGGIPNCKAGERFMVVNPDGTFRPCSMFDLKFKTREEMVEKFTKNNTCGACYVSIRSYLSKNYSDLLITNIRERVLKSRSHNHTRY